MEKCGEIWSCGVAKTKYPFHSGGPASCAGRGACVWLECVFACGIVTTLLRHKNVSLNQGERQEEGGLQILYKLAPVQKPADDRQWLDI